MKKNFFILIPVILVFCACSSQTTILSQTNAPPYYTIIESYLAFIHRDVNADIEVELNNLYDTIRMELNLDDEQKEYELWNSLVDMPTEKLNYAYYDLNNDSISELLILSEGDVIHAIYSMDENVPVLVDGYWSRKICVIDETRTLYIHASSGASDYYAASYLFVSVDESLKLIEMVGVESYDKQTAKNLSKPQWYWIQNDVKSIIGYEEAQNLLMQFPDAPSKDIKLIICSF